MSVTNYNNLKSADENVTHYSNTPMVKCTFITTRFNESKGHDEFTTFQADYFPSAVELMFLLKRGAKEGLKPSDMKQLAFLIEEYGDERWSSGNEAASID